MNPRHDVEMKPLYCVRHLTHLLQVHCNKEQFSSSMFDGNKAQREQAQSLFSYDLANRVHAEFNAAHKMYGDNVVTLKNRMHYLYDTLVQCYKGDCTGCNLNSFVCSTKTPWQRLYISTCSDYESTRAVIHPSSKDTTKLHDILNI